MKVRVYPVSTGSLLNRDRKTLLLWGDVNVNRGTETRPLRHSHTQSPLIFSAAPVFLAQMDLKMIRGQPARHHTSTTLHYSINNNKKFPQIHASQAKTTEEDGRLAEDTRVHKSHRGDARGANFRTILPPQWRRRLGSWERAQMARADSRRPAPSTLTVIMGAAFAISADQWDDDD